MTEENTQPIKASPPPELRYLDPEQVRIFRMENGQTRVTIGEECSILAPKFLRASPLNDPDRYISIREGVFDGRELGLLRNWRKLDHESRALVQEELDRRYLYPILKRVLAAKDVHGIGLCTFETDRGVRDVTLRDIHENIVYLGPKRILITDAEGNRYDIPDIDALDRASRMMLSRIL